MWNLHNDDDRFWVGATGLRTHVTHLSDAHLRNIVGVFDRLWHEGGLEPDRERMYMHVMNEIEARDLGAVPWT